VRLVNLKTQQFEDVADDQAQAAFQAGTHGFESPDQKVPIKAPDGSIGTVDAKDAAEAFQQGASLAPHEEYRKAVVQEKYGGIGGQLAAIPEGLARGAGAGFVSDPLAIKIGEMLGRGKEVREHLAGVKEANPITSALSEIAGAALPVLATGGAAAPEEVAGLAARGGVEALEGGAGVAKALTGAGELAAKGGAVAAEAAPALAEAAPAAAEGGGRMAALLKAVGAPARAVGQAGEAAGGFAERAMTTVMGSPAADGALGRIARMAIKNGATGAAEGALFGAGNEVSEDALGDHELNAEKMVAAMGHGALYGAMIGTAAGAGIGTAKESIGAILSRVAPHLERQADLQAVRTMGGSAGGMTGLLKRAAARGVSREDLGEAARKFEIVPSSLTEAMKTTPEDLLSRTHAAEDAVGQKIQQIVEGSGATVKASQILEPLDRRIEGMERTAAGKDAAGALRGFRDQLAESLGLPKEGELPTAAAAPEAPTPARVQRTPQEIAEYLRANPETKFEKSGAPPPEALYKSVEAPAQKVAPEAAASVSSDPDVPVQKLVEERRALQRRMFQDIKAQTVRWPIDEMRSFTGDMGALEQKAIDGAEHTLGPDQGKALRAANRDYQMLQYLREGYETRVAKATSLRAVSPTSYLSGMAVAAGSIAHGNVLGAAGGVATALGHQMLLERGNAVASAMFGKIAKLDLIARSAERVDGEIDGAVKAFVSKPTRTAEAPKIRLRHFASQPTSDVQDRYEEARKTAPASPQSQITPQHVEKAIPGLAQHAPKTAQAVGALVGKSAQMLAAAVPKGSALPTVLSPNPKPNDMAASQYLRVRGAVEDPVGTIKRGLETGKIHQDEIEAIKASKPKLFAEVQEKLVKAVAEHRDEMTYDKVFTLSKITGMPLDPSLTAESVAGYQQTFAQQQPAPQPTGAPSGKAPKRKLDGVSRDTSLATGQTQGDAP
jgi:hypothetical protein